MSPTLATLLTFAGILYLLRRDAVRGETQSPALWIPVLWLSITGSRFVSQWIDLGGTSGSNFTDGSPIDAVYFSTLIAAGLWVLYKRDTRLGEVVRNNGWIVALAVFSFISIGWSDESFIAFKRWVKTLGHPIVALIILTEPDPKAALRTVLKRCAMVLLPLSVLFVKYLPEIGRSYDPWTGAFTSRGAGLTKNDLGYVCMVSGIILAWNLLTLNRIADPRARRVEMVLSLGLLAMVIWLLGVASSATSVACLLVGVGVLLALGWRFVTKRFFGSFVVVVLLSGFALDSAFNLYENIVLMLGRDPTLTDRTVVWGDVLALQQRPIIGYGFESFWFGERMDAMWAKWWWRPTQAHSGYIETYLNLGLIGVGLLAMVLLSTFRRISRQLQTDFEFARLRMAFLFVVILFNYTEAAFKGVHFMWTIFFIIAMEMPRRPSADEAQPEVRT